MIQGKPYPTGQVDGRKHVEIPKGWSRSLENGSVQYISPSSSSLKSLEHVIEYLKADGTCKCGLDCPLYVHRVFNFDSSVPNKERQDELPGANANSSTCRLCESNRLMANRFTDQKQSPFNQTLNKQTARKTAKQSPVDGTSKKGSNRSRTKQGDSPKGKRVKKASSPFSDVPSPPPSVPISSPVQNVPNNLGANQGPLPSFASSFVSSSKFFNPGPNRGPLYPTSSFPLKANMSNAFVYAKPVQNAVVAPEIKNTQVTDQIHQETLPSHTTPTTAISSILTSKVPYASNVLSTLSASPTLSSVSTVSSTLGFPTTGSTTTVASVKKEQTMPNVFTSLDRATVMPTEAAKIPSKPQSKSKPRSRPKPKSKADPKKVAKPRAGKLSTDSSTYTVPGVPHASPATSAVITTSSPKIPTCPWTVPVSSVMTSPTPYQISTFNATNTSISKSSSSMPSIASYTTGNPLNTRQPMAQQVAQQQVTLPSSIYMSSDFQNQGIRPPGQIQSFVSSGIRGTNPQPPQAKTSITQSIGGSGDTNGKTSNLSRTVAAASSNYPVVATPRIQAPPGMMYVTATPGVGVFPSSYPYVAASTQQMHMAQGSINQQHNQSSSVAATVAPTCQQSTMVSQGVASDAAGISQSQGKVSFQVPGMYVQGAASNQMFPINPQSFNMGQYKGAYQLQSNMYQSAIPGGAMAFIAPNAAKAAYPGIQAVASGNIGQFTYQNPYMFGIVMPPSTTQQSPVTLTPTRSSPATPTGVTTSLQMLQPQTIQNPAVAAAFESFVPIAPAAGGSGPRFAQTLAHLASAYNTFPTPGLVQGPNANQIQLAYQMMQMNPNQPSAHTAQIPNVGGLVTPEVVVKHPVTASSKQSSLTSTATVAATTKAAVTHIQTKAQTQLLSPPVSTTPPMMMDHSVGKRSPYSSTTISSPLPLSSSPCTSAFSVYTTATATSVQSPPQCYPASASQLDPGLHNYRALQSLSQDNTPEPVSNTGLTSLVYHSSNSINASQGSYESQVKNHHHEMSNCTATSQSSSSNTINTNRTSITVMPSTSTSGAVSTGTTHSGLAKVSQSASGRKTVSTEQLQLKKNTSLVNDTPSRGSSLFAVKLENHQPVSPVRTSTSHLENTGLTNSLPCVTNTAISQEEAPSTITNTCKQEEGALTSNSIPTKRTLENNESLVSTKRTKYDLDNVNYYETNPLLGMKRSCEAIEVYPDPPETTDHDDEDEEDEEREGYCSSNEDDMQRTPIGKDSTPDVMDLRRGDSLQVERPFPMRNQVHTPPKDMYNGGCIEVHNEQEMPNEHLGGGLKSSPPFVAAPFRAEMFGELSIPHVRPHFDIGDVVWAQARGLPSWPGQIVDESKVGKGRADDGKKWVMWFGDHTFSQVEVDRLKTLSDGLRTLDDKARKKKYRAKKARISLEQAISEALEELEMRDSRLKAKQGMRSKSKKKRVR